MEDDDSKTVEHISQEMSPKEHRRFSRRTTLYLGICVAVMWIGALYFEGWQGLHWGQIAMGALSAFWLFGALAMHTDFLKS